jgi:hypothetical protein
VAHDDGKTPEAHMAMKRRMPGGERKTITSLSVLARNGFRQADGREVWATPKATDAERGGRGDLIQQVRGNESPSGHFKQWPTPKASPSGPDYARMDREGSGGDDLATSVARDTPGQLNPEWVEWLMGYPTGWTALPPSETASSRKSRNGSGNASSNERND